MGSRVPAEDVREMDRPIFRAVASTTRSSLFTPALCQSDTELRMHGELIDGCGFDEPTITGSDHALVPQIHQRQV